MAFLLGLSCHAFVVRVPHSYVSGSALASSQKPSPPPFEFTSIKNVRDVASVAPTLLKPGCLFRSGMPSNATEEDVAKYLGGPVSGGDGGMGIKTLIDLRSLTEINEDGKIWDSEIYEGFENVVWKRSTGAWIVDKAGRGIRKLRRRSVDQEEDPPPVRGNERHFVSLMDERKYVIGTLQRLRKRTISKLLFTSPAALTSKRVRAKSKKMVVETINDGGLPMLNELIIQMARRGIRYVLNVISDPDRHPVAVYCTAGKDRTGVLVAILLSTLGVEDADIVKDYELSRNVYKEMADNSAMVGALQQRDLNPDVFLDAPAQVMTDTLTGIREIYGSVDAYLDW